MFDSRLQYSFDMLTALKSKFTDKVFETIIHVNVKLKEAANKGVSVFLFDKYCRGSKDYFSLAREMISAQSQQEKAEFVSQQVSNFVKAEFMLYAPAANEVYLAGDFNHWTPNENSRLIRGQDGTWRKALKLSPGRYRYRFVIDGRWQEDPNNPLSEINSFGEPDSLLELK
ncbi:MAG: isoamylase early set domain-containing protein [Candidatus Omnitrophota bacterium]